MRRFFLSLKIAFGQHVDIADVCRYDLHDYPVYLGGNGQPWHFYTYTCWNCGKRFTI